MAHGVSSLSLHILANQGAEPTLPAQSMSTRPPDISLLTRAYPPLRLPTLPHALPPASPAAMHLQPMTNAAKHSATQCPASTAPSALTTLPYRSFLPVSLGPSVSATLPLHPYKDPPPAYAPYQSHLPAVDVLPFAFPAQLGMGDVQRGFGGPWSTSSPGTNMINPFGSTTFFPPDSLFDPIFTSPAPVRPEKPPIRDSVNFGLSYGSSTGAASPHALAPGDESKRAEANQPSSRLDPVPSSRLDPVPSSLLDPAPFSSSPTVSSSTAKDPFMGFMPIFSPRTYGTASPSELNLSAPAPQASWKQTHPTSSQIPALPSAIPRLSSTAELPLSTQLDLHPASPIVRPSTGVPAPTPRVANWKPIEERPIPPRLERISAPLPPAPRHVNPGLMVDPSRHPLGVSPVALNSASTTGWTVSTDVPVPVSHTAGSLDGEDADSRGTLEGGSCISGSTFHTPDRSGTLTLDDRSSNPRSSSTESKGWTSDRPHVATARAAMEFVRELSRAGGRRKRAEASPGSRVNQTVPQVRRRKITKEAERSVCFECDMSFSRKNDMERHFMSKHTQLRPFRCDHCGATFPRSDKLGLHLRARSGACARGRPGPRRGRGRGGLSKREL